MTLNLRAVITMPWAVVPRAIYLGAYWKVVSGRWAGGSRHCVERRINQRANSLEWSLWCASIAAGLLGFGAILALLVLMARLVAMPDATPITTPPGMPLLTGLALLTMQSVVAGVTEETAFRGYMQSIGGAAPWHRGRHPGAGHPVRPVARAQSPGCRAADAAVLRGPCRPSMAVSPGRLIRFFRPWRCMPLATPWY